MSSTPTNEGVAIAASIISQAKGDIDTADALWAVLTPADRRSLAAKRGWATRKQRADDLAYAVRTGWTANGYARSAR